MSQFLSPLHRCLESSSSSTVWLLWNIMQQQTSIHIFSSYRITLYLPTIQLFADNRCLSHQKIAKSLFFVLTCYASLYKGGALLKLRQQTQGDNWIRQTERKSNTQTPLHRNKHSHRLQIKKTEDNVSSLSLYWLYNIQAG